MPVFRRFIEYKYPFEKCLKPKLNQKGAIRIFCNKNNKSRNKKLQLELLYLEILTVEVKKFEIRKLMITGYCKSAAN